MEEISIQQVVSEIVASGGDQSTFFIRFVKSSGNEKGHIKTVAKAIYGAPKSKQAATTPQTNKSLHKDKNTLPLTDLERNQYITPLVSHIIQFNKYKVRH